MMMTRILLASALVVNVIGGCTDTTLDGPVDYELSAFEATVHTTLHIELDGTVTRTVTSTDQPSTTETATLESAALEDLVRKINNARFPTLAPMYGCGGCLDDAVYKITVRIDGAPYTVRTDSREDYPDRLRPVIETLHDISEQVLDWRKQEG